MIRSTIAALVFSFTTTAFAACPPPADISDEESRLFETAQKAESHKEGQEITRALWRLWATAPDEQSQALLDRGMSARSSYDFLGAIDAFDRLTKYCPDYAEGYNQRAFVNFLREDFGRALIDLERALERNPRHVAALAGMALTLMRLEKNEEAQQVLREALKLNPWIPERGLLQRQKGIDL